MENEEMTNEQFRYIVKTLLETIEKEAETLKDEEERERMLTTIKSLIPKE